MLGKELSSSWLSACADLFYAVLSVPFRVGIWNRLWNATVSVPDHFIFICFTCIYFSCYSFYVYVLQYEYSNFYRHQCQLFKHQIFNQFIRLTRCIGLDRFHL